MRTANIAHIANIPIIANIEYSKHCDYCEYCNWCKHCHYCRYCKFRYTQLLDRLIQIDLNNDSLSEDMGIKNALSRQTKVFGRKSFWSQKFLDARKMEPIALYMYIYEVIEKGRASKKDVS